MILFSELFIVGYSPEDLVLKPALQADARAAVEETGGGYRRWRPCHPDRHALGGSMPSSTMPWRCWMAARSQGLTYKHELPNYGVFDEKRVFAQGPTARTR